MLKCSDYNESNSLWFPRSKLKGGEFLPPNENECEDKTVKKNRFSSYYGKMPKYEIVYTMEKQKCSGVYINSPVYRIRALRNFSDVKKGDLGGFVQNVTNLSHDGNCWIYDDAVVMDNAIVCGNATIHDNSTISDYAVVCGLSKVMGNAVVMDNAVLYDSAFISGYDRVANNMHVDGTLEDYFLYNE